MTPSAHLARDLARTGLLDHVAHRHEHDELTWVASGSCALLIDGHRWLIDSETALVVPAGVEHIVIPRPDSLVFPLLFPEGLAEEPEPLALRRTAMLDTCARVLLQSGLATAEATAAARRGIRAIVSAAAAVPELPLPADERARAVATAILREPASRLGLLEWARSVHTSEKTLQRCFVRETGLTFPQWRTRARLAAARELLDRGGAVEAVAHSVGYATASAFIAAFRRGHGVTPGRYRARTQEG